MSTILHRLRSYRSALVSPLALSVALVACGSEGEGGPDVPEYNAFQGPGNTGTQNGTQNNGSQVVPGANNQTGNAPAGQSTEQPGANPSFNGNQGTTNPPGTPNTGAGGSANTGAGGSAAVIGSGGSSMVAAGGSSMAIPNPAPGAGGQPVQQPPPVGSNCDGAAFFCEDFDAFTLGALQGVTNGLEAERTVSIVTEPGRGNVLGVSAGRGYDQKAGVFLNDFSAPNNSYFGRMFVNVAQYPATGGDHWVMVEATGAGSIEQVRPVGGQFGRWAPGSDGPSAQDWTDWDQSSVAVAAGAWECVEWQMDGANGNNDIVLWVDGVEIQPLDRPNFSYPTIDRLWLGWVVYQNQGQPTAYDARIDDVVLSTQRIGCN
jgi:hypothetical protein